MERIGIEYLANAFWQLPLLALGAWSLLRIWRPGPAAQHRVWLLVLALALLLPLRGAIPAARQTPNLSLAEVAISTASDAPTHFFVPLAAIQGDPSATGNSETMLNRLEPAFLAHACRVPLSAAAVDWILALWLATALFGLLRLALAWRAARRLVRGSCAIALDARQSTSLQECARRLRVIAPEIRQSDALAGPVVAGTLHPVLLWPARFQAMSSNELTAALCHELAHIRRHDYGTNLLCETAALPLKWHPVAYVVERRIRATREMACDAMAAKTMQSQTVYATCLVSLARSIAGGARESTFAAGLFNGSAMEERVLRLMQSGKTISLRARVARASAGTTALAATIALAAAFHVVPVMAQTVPTPPVPSPAHVAPPQSTAPATPMPPVAPSVPSKQVKPVVQTPRTPPVPPPPVEPPAPAKPDLVPHVQNQRELIIYDESDLTPAERARLERQLQEAEKRIAAATAKLDSPEFRQQIEDAQRKALQAETMLNSAQFKQQMADAQKQVAEATARLNRPEFRRKIQAQIDAAMKINSAQIQQQVEKTQAAALKAQTCLNSAAFQKQMAEAQKQIAETTARLNSPEFRRQIEEAAQAASKINSAEFQKQMADAQKQLADALAQIEAQQHSSTSSQKVPANNH